MSEFKHHVSDMCERDICILPVEEEGLYYFYTTRAPHSMRELGVPRFYARRSPDLINWSDPIIVFENKGEFWSDLDYWAPECHFYNGKYYLISSFRAVGTYRRCQCLVSDSPAGPFVPHGEPFTPEDWHCLDGTLYVDRQGKPWMIFCKEWLQVGDGQICAVPMKEDLSAADGEPIILFRASQAAWKSDAYAENREDWGRVTDGPYMYRCNNGTLIMVWSSFSNSGYTVGTARSTTGDIAGPWEVDPEPIYSLDGGHPMLFKSFEGELMMVFHSPNKPGQERMLVFKMDDIDGHLYTKHEITGNWYSKFYYPDGRMIKI